jgi:hypothetical protein
MTATRNYRLPAVEIAEARNALPLVQHLRAQRAMMLGLSILTLVCGYFVADAGLVVSLLVLFGSFTTAGAVARLRTYGSRYNLTTELRAHIHEEDRWYIDSMMHALKNESRVIVRNAAVGLGLVAAAVFLTVRGGGRWWLIGACGLLVTYVASSVRFFGERSPDFQALAMKAAEKRCRIGLFRAFRSDSAELATNVLVPILMGYGEVQLVRDPTLEESKSHGVFGFEKIPIATIPQFAIQQWQAKVREIIQTIDIAIIDVSVTTDGVMWEVAQCFAALPPYRVLLFVNGVELSNQSYTEYMKAFYHQLSAHPEMPRDVRPWVFYFAPVYGHEVVVSSAIHEKMKEIVEREHASRDSV